MLCNFIIFSKKKAEEEDKKGKVREILSESLEGFAERKIKELPIFIGRLGTNFTIKLTDLKIDARCKSTYSDKTGRRVKFCDYHCVLP